MSELRLVEHAESTPGACLRCSNHVGPFVDLGIQHHVEGWLYVCVLCVDSIAETRGGASPEQVARFEALLNDAAERIEELKAKLSESRRTVVADFADFLNAESAEDRGLRSLSASASGDREEVGA